MFFPIADTPKPPGRPYVTWGLMAINIGVFLLLTYPATRARVDLTDPVLIEYLKVIGLYGKVSAREVYHYLSAYDLMVFEFGFRPAKFSVATLLSSLFLHGGFMHLAGNMLFLYIFGNNVEYRLGWWRFLLTYLGCGVIATLFFALFAPGSEVPLIGASGAIFGILGCYFLWFPRNRVRCFIFLFPFLVTTVLLPARWILGFYLLVDNLLPFLLTGSYGSGIAHGAHIGGFMGGLAIAWVGNRYASPARPQRQAGAAGADRPLASLQQICPAVRAGEVDAAARCYLGLTSRAQRRQVATQDILSVGNYLLEAGRTQDALGLFRRFIAERPRDPALDHAYFGAGRAMLKNPRYLTSAYHYFLAAIDLSQDEVLRKDARRYLRLIEQGRDEAAEAGD
ncbi:MAG: rhomboid family intramembrane serine protease [Pelovirga sp.]